MRKQDSWQLAAIITVLVAMAALLAQSCATHGPHVEAPKRGFLGNVKMHKQIIPRQRRAEKIAKVMAVAWAAENAPDRVEMMMRLPPPTIYWVSGDKKCSDNGRKAFTFKEGCYLGLHYRWDYIFVAQQKRISLSAFSHEMAHAYRVFLKGDPNGTHSDTVWWQYWVGNVNGVIRFHEETQDGAIRRLRDGRKQRDRRCVGDSGRGNGVSHCQGRGREPQVQKFSCQAP